MGMQPTLAYGVTMVERLADASDVVLALFATYFSNGRRGSFLATLRGHTCL